MSRAHPTEAPFSPPPLPGVSETNRMTYFWLSEYMANTASYVYQKAGAFKHTLTPENVKVGPTGVCYRVYTACTVSAVCTYNAYIQLNESVERAPVCNCRLCTYQFRPNEDEGQLLETECVFTVSLLQDNQLEAVCVWFCYCVSSFITIGLTLLLADLTLHADSSLHSLWHEYQVPEGHHP